MPLNCPINLPEFFDWRACDGCRFHNEDECWYSILAPIKLRDILTFDERLRCAEFSAVEKKLPLTNVSLKAYQQQGNMVRYLQRKMNELIDATKKKRKVSKYD